MRDREPSTRESWDTRAKDADREDAMSSVSIGRQASFARSPGSVTRGLGPGSAVSGTSEVGLSPPPAAHTPLAGVVVVDEDELRKAAMHTAAERAKLRRQQEEEEREKEKERARKKAAELEEKILASELEAFFSSCLAARS